ncbi:hypothetical protein C8029_17350 [Roseobacter sp. TSBP12]|nr:hypothetical protein C8029_17350 [Roseobacter sp. TSBP12]|tara:strand:+ start:2448 stop:2627 length:180 start_codon:yes stop_codon:yes gene_type:complete
MLQAVSAIQPIEDGTADYMRRFIHKRIGVRQEIVADALDGLSYTSSPMPLTSGSPCRMA